MSKDKKHKNKQRAKGKKPAKKQQNVKYIEVAVPFFCNRFDFEVKKRQGWSILDFLIIRELYGSDMSHATISSLLNLHPKISLQILLPMCDAGWVEIKGGDNGFVFSLTDIGEDVYQLSKDECELPYIENTYQSKREICVDVTGEYHNFYKKNLSLFHKTALAKYKASSSLPITEMLLERPTSRVEVEYELLVKAAANEDEEVRNYKTITSNYFDDIKYLVVKLVSTENNGYKILNRSIAELLNPKLKKLIEQNDFKDSSVKFSMANKPKAQIKKYKVAREQVDFTYGGQDTKVKLLELIDASKSFLIIHSTFIRGGVIRDPNTNDYTDVFQAVKKAVVRGVDVYVLWGKTERTEDEEDFNSSQNEDLKVEQRCRAFNAMLVQEGIHAQVNFNNFTRTESHAKYIITDHATKGCCTMISSCNFLYTNFKIFETSAVVYDDHLTAKMLRVASSMSTGKMNSIKNWDSSETADQLEMIANNILEYAKQTKVIKGDVLEMRLVNKPEHIEYINNAGEEVNRRLYVVSDFISDTAERPIFDNLAPLKVKDKLLYYKKPKNINTEQLKQYTKDLSELDYPIKLNSISGKDHNAKSHAKFLAWDDDDIFLTSFNWLSANAEDKNGGEYHELGLHIHGSNVATELINAFLPVAKN